MKTIIKYQYVSVLIMLVLVILIAIPKTSSAAQAPVNLGTTSTYAVLAGTTITNTGTTTINGSAGGNVGISPGSSFTGDETLSLSGALHVADVEANIAKTDLIVAYDDAAGRLPVTRIPTELGGTTLTPGIYDSADGRFQITGTLTLDAQGDPDGVFVFKTDTTLITATDSSVNLINSARFCRTFWKVGSSATLGSNSHFVGHILALTSITVDTGAFIQGQLLARNGAVTLDANTITNGLCETVQTPTVTPTTPTLTSEEKAALESGVDSANANANATPAPTKNTITTNTISGGELPKTSSPWYNVLLVGVAFLLVGAVGFRSRKRYK